jgi:Zn-dependent M28 family amino/carboxypeptidase
MLGLLLLLPAAVFSQSGPFIQLPREIIEDRLVQYQGSDSFRATTLKHLFQNAGCSGERLTEQKVPHSANPNIICTLPGTGNQVIIVGAHFDHVSKGSGVVDNWSGASLLPSLYQSLSSIPRHHTFVFISFTDEERGFVGSRFYADQLAKDAVTRITGMIDVDTLGLGPTEVWVTNSDPGLVKRLGSTAAAMKLPASEMNVDGVGNSDGDSFKRRDIPVITLHSVTNATLGILHSKNDNLSAIRRDDYYNSYKLIAGYLTVLDSASAE